MPDTPSDPDDAHESSHTPWLFSSKSIPSKEKSWSPQSFQSLDSKQPPMVIQLDLLRFHRSTKHITINAPCRKTGCQIQHHLFHSPQWDKICQVVKFSFSITLLPTSQITLSMYRRSVLLPSTKESSSKRSNLPPVFFSFHSSVPQHP